MVLAFLSLQRIYGHAREQLCGTLQHFSSQLLLPKGLCYKEKQRNHLAPPPKISIIPQGQPTCKAAGTSGEDRDSGDTGDSSVILRESLTTTELVRIICKYVLKGVISDQTSPR